MKEEIDKVFDRINKLSELDFKEQLECIKELNRIAANDYHQFRKIMEDTEYGLNQLDKIHYLGCYNKGDENQKDGKGEWDETGLFYSKLSDEKKKEFLECANKVLEIFEKGVKQ